MIMIRKFINRKSELDFLKREYDSPRFSFVVIYGRRRVGKTELVLQFAKDYPHIYLLADKSGTLPNIIRFRRKVARFFNDIEPSVKSFEDLFEYILSRWTQKKKLIVIIDEFSYLVEKDDSIPSTFQVVIDEILSKYNNIFLILTGSLVGMIEKGVLSYASPLYGRRTGQIKLEPFRFKEIFDFFPSLNVEELIKIYGAVGGTPYYLKMFNPNKDFLENVKNLFLNKYSILYTEGFFLLKEELRDPSTYFNILNAIANGATRVSEIATKAFLDAKDLPHYLSTLQRLGYIRRERPILEKASTKKSIYRISDDFIRFWFKYVYSYHDDIESDNTNYVLSEIKKTYNMYLSLTFEKVAIEVLREMNRLNLLPFKFQRIGRQWGKIKWQRRGINQYEIDILAHDSTMRKIIVGECKWKENVNPQKLFNNLQEKIKYIPIYDKVNKIHYVLFAKSFLGNLDSKNVTLISLDKIKNVITRQ